MPTTTTIETPRKGAALALACAAQFMVILDVAIVNVALPSIQSHFHTGRATIEWVVIAYGLLLGGFLLLGGRLADRYGPRAVLITGLVVFSLASLGAGLTSTVGWLVAARAAQGLGAALIPPATLTIIATTFTGADERARALGWYGAISGISASVGVIASGLITDSVGWRWVFLINVPIGVLLIAAAARVVTPKKDGARASIDILGTTLATSGLLALVYGLNRGAQHGWTTAATIATFAIAAALLVLFIFAEARTDHPLIPRALLGRRTFVGANLAAFFAFGSVFGFIFLGSLLMQQQLGYSPIQTGLAWLATTAMSFVTAATTGAVLVRVVGVRRLLITGQALMALAALLLMRIPADGDYLRDVLPAFVALGIGGGLAAPAAQIAALSDVEPAQAGTASGLLETLREIGGAGSVAIVSTVLLSGADTIAAAHGAAQHAASAHVFHLAYGVIVVFAAVGALVSAATIRVTKADDGDHERPPAPVTRMG